MLSIICFWGNGIKEKVLWSEVRQTSSAKVAKVQYIKDKTDKSDFIKVFLFYYLYTKYIC